jgi:hypothetical protein
MPNFVDETLKLIKNINMKEQRDFFNQSKEKLLQDYQNFYFE